ncbi:hypothetical protein GGR51DRAFT_502064 [Nemania sp. FL0031]|nr:hypothetical protein GGR51DRAFT_502064 [Nemania sp. FL0031]
MDSVPDLERMLNFAKKYRKFLHHFNITLYVNDPVSAESVPVPQPHNDWASGFHLIENARVFFREPLGEGSKARSWHESQACKKLRATDSQVSAALYESHMVKKWVDFARLELGHADRAPIRSSGTKLPALAARASK